MCNNSSVFVYDLVDIRIRAGTPFSANIGAFGAQIRLTSWPRLPQCYLYPLIVDRSGANHNTQHISFNIYEF